MVLVPGRAVLPVELVRLEDRRSGLDGVIAIHSTERGPAAGGCRFWSYPDTSAAVSDACRLAEGMSYKNAMAGLPLGGGKAVLRRPAGDYDRRALFEAFGRAVERLDGRYVTAEDVGTTTADMEWTALATRHVAGRTARPGYAGGDPSPWTALGVFEAMKAAVVHRFGGELAGVTVAIAGVGNVGTGLARLLAKAGAELVIADPDAARCHALADETGARVVPVAEVAQAQAEVFAPCALGGALDASMVAALKAQVVCGAANNQLAGPQVTDLLLARGVVYAPDYVVNAGGIINVAAEYLGERESGVRERVLAIGPRTAAILDEAAATRQSPATVADAMAERLIRTPEFAVL